MNIVERASTDGSKVYYTLEWGRLPGQRFSTKLFTYTNPKDKIQRDFNTASRKQLELTAAEVTLELQTKGTVMAYSINAKKNFLSFFEKYVEKNQSDTNRSLPACMKKFKEFVAEDQKVEVTKNLFISAPDITENYCERFRKHLLDTLTGETPGDYFMRFKRVMKAARKQGYFRIDPVEDLASKKHPSGVKETLTVEEYMKLIDSFCNNYEVKKAAICSLYSGFRWCDVSTLCWHQVKEDKIMVKQSKTGEYVGIPLHQVVKALLGDRGEPDELVFKLPSYTTAITCIQAWVKNAGIDKHITWHCFRHTVSDLLQDAKVDIHVVAGFLGHTTAKYILAVYKKRLRARDVLAAGDALPALNTIDELGSD